MTQTMLLKARFEQHGGQTPVPELSGPLAGLIFLKKKKMGSFTTSFYFRAVVFKVCLCEKTWNRVNTHKQSSRASESWGKTQ